MYNSLKKKRKTLYINIDKTNVNLLVNCNFGSYFKIKRAVKAIQWIIILF